MTGVIRSTLVFPCQYQFLNAAYSYVILPPSKQSRKLRVSLNKMLLSLCLASLIMSLTKEGWQPAQSVKILTGANDGIFMVSKCDRNTQIPHQRCKFHHSSSQADRPFSKIPLEIEQRHHYPVQKKKNFMKIFHNFMKQRQPVQKTDRYLPV